MDDVVKKYQDLLKKKKELEDSSSRTRAVLEEKNKQLDKFLVDLKEREGVGSIDELKALRQKTIDGLSVIVSETEKKCSEAGVV